MANPAALVWWTVVHLNVPVGAAGRLDGGGVMAESGQGAIEHANQLEAEPRLAQRTSEETLALLEMLQDKAPVGFGFVNLQFQMMRVNETLAAINGLTVAEQLGQPVAVIVPQLWSQLEPLYHRVLDSRQAVCGVQIHGITAADPSRMHHWLSNLYPVFVDGEVIGIGVVVVDISERTDAEDARRRLARIVQDSGDAIISAGLGGITTTWNAAAERMFGYTAAEMIGQPVAMLAPAGLVSEQEQMRARMHAGGATERVETVRRRKDGSLLNVLVTASPSIDGTGAVVGVSVMMQDITKSHAVLRELQVSRRRLAEAQRIAEIGSFELDLVTGELIWSAEHYRILGLDRTLTPTPDLFIPLVHPDDLPMLVRAWEQAAQGVGFDLRYRIIRPSGEQRWVHTRAVPEVADDGTVVRLAGTLRDETAQVEIARERREADARFETSFEQAGIGAAIADLDGIPIRVNNAVCSILGRPKAQLVNRSWAEYTHPDDARPHESIRAEVAAGHDDYQEQRRFIRPDGSTVWCSLHTTLVRDESGEPEYYLAQLQDITERRQMHADLAHQALHDRLTGLANGTLLTDRLNHALARARRNNSRLAVIFFDLDQFKAVNDSFGHGVGDDLINQVAIRVSSTIRDSDTVARFGGDEFVIVCDANSIQDTERTAERVLAAIREPFHIGDREINVTSSAGIAYADRDSTPDSLLRDSDHAMYVAKSLGRDRVEMFDEGLRARAERRVHTATALRHALDRNELSVHYQPVIDLASGAMVSAEALLRWNHPAHPGHPDQTQISPAEFIPIAEESGLIIPIGAWVVEQACQQLSTWQRTEPSMSVAVNLSVVQVLAPGIIEQIEAVLTRTQIRPETLHLELTESVFMHDTDHFGKVLTGLKNLGVRLSLDDFGTGYSSLSYLSRFPFDAVKIDQTFIRGLGIHPHDTALVAAILSMAAALGLSVTAEGIEDESQLALLKNMHCQRGQGFHLGRPMPAEALSQRVGHPVPNS